MASSSPPGELLTAAGVAIPRLAPETGMFLNRTTVLYGPSGSGKTVIIQNILELLRGHVDLALVMSPTEPMNQSYKGIIPDTLIHSSFFLPNPDKPDDADEEAGLLRFLESLWQRQEMMLACYNRANDPETLARLYSRLPHSALARGGEIVKRLDRKRREFVARVKEKYADRPEKLAEKKQEINRNFKKLVTGMHKSMICSHAAALWEHRSRLSEDEQYALIYRRSNPNLLLIFDDCAAAMKKLWKKKVFREIFYQGRHNRITTIITCQYDTDLDSNLRDNTFVSFYTARKTFFKNFSRGSKDLEKDEIKRIQTLAHTVFSNDAPHRKLAHIRLDPSGREFYHIQFPLIRCRPFGSAALQELCGIVHSDKVSIDKSNPHFKSFELPA